MGKKTRATVVVAPNFLRIFRDFSQAPDSIIIQELYSSSHRLILIRG